MRPKQNGQNSQGIAYANNLASQVFRQAVLISIADELFEKSESIPQPFAILFWLAIINDSSFPPSSMNTSDIKILVVDDKPNNLRFLSKILAKQGYQVQRAISGQLALNAVNAAAPDLILLDIMMPKMDGYEVCQRLKAQPETCEIPIIFLSALHDTADKVRGFRVGGVDYITKPFQIAEVLARIESQLTIKRLQQKLKEQNAQLRLLERAIAAANNGIVITDAQAENNPLIYVNSGFERMTGYSASEVLGKNCRFLQGTDSEQPARDRLREAIATGRDCQVTLRNRRKNGEVFWNELTISPVCDASGQLAHFIGVQVDMSDRIAAEQALEAASSRFSTLIQNLQAGVLVEDETQHILLANRSFCQMFGLTVPPEELVGVDCTSLLSSVLPLFSQPQYFSERIQAISEAKEPVVNEEFFLADGRTFEQDYVPIFVDSGYSGHLWMYRDITERKQAQLTLEHQLLRTILLKNLTQQIRSSLDSQTIFQTTVEQLGKAFNANRCVIHTYTADPVKQFPCVAEYLTQDFTSLLNVEIPVEGNPHAQTLLAQERAIASDSIYTDPLLEPIVQLAEQLQVKSMLAVRTSYRGRANGTVVLQQCDGFRTWREDEIELLEAVAEQVGIAIAQAQLWEREKQRRQELDRQNHQLQEAINKRQQVEASLRESEERWHLALRGTGDGIWDWNLKTNQVSISSRLAEILGYAPQNLNSFVEWWTANIHPQDYERVIEARQSHLDRQTPYFSAEYRLRDRQGNYQWILDRGQAIWDETGQPTRMVGSYSDIRDRKHQEEALRLIAEATAAQTGRKFFYTCTRHLAQVLKVRYAFICEAVDADKPRVQTLAFWAGKAFKKNFEYDLAGTPCSEVLKGESCYYPHSVQEQFPSDRDLVDLEVESYWGIPLPSSQGNLLGHLALMDTAPMTLSPDKEQILQIFAARIAAELERKQTEETLERRAERDRLLSQISHALLDRELDVALQFTLQAIGEFTESDRCYICQFHSDFSRVSMTHEWCAEGIEAKLSLYQNLPMSAFPYTGQTLQQKNSLSISDVDDLPSTASREKKWLQEGGVKSLVAVPLQNFGATNGVIGLSSLHSLQTWDEETISFLRLVGELIAIAQRRHEAQMQLRGSQQRLSFLVEQTPLAVLEWDANLKTRTWNPAAEKIFGYSQAEILGQPGLDFIVSPDIRPRIEDIAAELLSQQGGTHSINSNLTKTGKTIICEWFNTPLIDRDGEAIGIASIAMDITERQQQEILERSQNVVLKKVTQGEPLREVLLELTRQNDFLLPNLRTSVLLLAADGKHLHSCISASLPPAYVEGLNHALPNIEIGPDVGCCGAAAYLGQRIITEDISISPQWEGFKDLAIEEGLRACWSEPIVSEKGKVLGTFAFYFTQTRLPDPREIKLIQGSAYLAALAIERKQAEAALETAKEAAEIANRSKSDFLASMSHELRTPLNAILGFSQILSSDTALSPKQQEHVAIINRSGEHLLTLINDILSMSKIEAGRMVLNKNQFDLHRLLGSIREMLKLRANAKGLELILHSSPDLPQYIETDESKLRQVLLNLLGNAIKFTPEGRVVLRVRSSELRELRGLGEASGASGASEAKLSLVSPNSPNSAVSPVSLVSPNSPHPTSYSLEFEVEDTGQGIAPEELDTLFDPFVQTATGRESMEGTGLGLPISQEFVRLMGGEITVCSQVGRGSTFSFEIRAGATDRTQTVNGFRQQHPIALEPNQPQYRILIVEDIADNRELLGNMLKPLGFEIEEAQNGREALEIWQCWHPHLILMDIRMPVMDGIEAIRQIRLREKIQLKIQNSQFRTDLACLADSTVRPLTSYPPSPVKIIALTASAFDEDRSAVFSVGGDDFLSKPFRSDILLDKLAAHLKVRYRYAESSVSGSPNAQPPAGVATVEVELLKTTMAAMPQAWLTELHQAAIEIDDRKILELLEEIPTAEMESITALKHWVENFRCDLIGDLAETLLV